MIESRFIVKTVNSRLNVFDGDYNAYSVCVRVCAFVKM